ncbi:MAG: OsmC family protein [Gemmatimonadetes bacterium]|nr:OsmC family protein [Gemmatimonadota bacterium]
MTGAPVSQPTFTTSWRGEQRFAVIRPGAAEMIIDGDRTAGPGPVETLLGALAACSAMDVVSYLAKRRTPASALDIEIDSTRRAEAPRRVMSTRLVFRLAGEGIDVGHASRAIELALASYCSVASSLASDLVIESQLVLNGEPHDVVQQQVKAVGA